MSSCLPLLVIVSVFVFTVSAFIFVTLTNIPIFFSGIPQHISSVPSIELDIQHFLKLFSVTSGEMRCLAIMIRIDQIIQLYFVIYKLT